MFTDEVLKVNNYIDLFMPKNNIPDEVQKLIDKECLEEIPPVKLYESQAILINKIDKEEVLNTLSFAGRICWDKDWNKNPEKFIENIIKLGHESVIEHVTFNFAILCSRSCSHQLVRHRIGVSYSQQSQRYVSYGNSASPVPIVVSPELSVDDQFFIVDGAIFCISHYRGGVTFSDIKPEVAREVLPESMGTILFVSFNPRSLRHFLEERMKKAAQGQIRSIANQIYDIMIESGLDVLVKDFEDLKEYDPRI